MSRNTDIYRRCDPNWVYRSLMQNVPFDNQKGVNDPVDVNRLNDTYTMFDGMRVYYVDKY